MAIWRKKKGLMRAPRYIATFDPMEREVLGEYAAIVAEALIQRCRSAPKDDLAELTGMPSGHREPPQDPSLARLLPDFERAGDEEYEGDNALLRSLHEHDICRAKLENLQVISQALGPDGGVSVQASEAEAKAWLYGLNDIRLFLASGELHGGEAVEQDRENVLEWLAYNEESLLTAMMGPLV